MKKNSPQADLEMIRQIMERSTKFLSLSGLAGVLAGIYALIGGILIRYALDIRPEQFTIHGYMSDDFRLMVVMGLLILFISLLTAIFFTRRKARSNNEKVWSASSRRFLVHVGLPLAAGGIMMLIFLKQGEVDLIIPSSLVFYGLAQCNASVYTYREVRWLGILEIILGLIALGWNELAIELWIIGFGVLHVVYGSFIYIRYESKGL